MNDKGLIHIYTGNGKGKTTAAVGLAVRALGHGLKVCYSFFNKKPDKYGYTEIDTLIKLGAYIHTQVIEHPTFNADVTIEQAQQHTANSIKQINKLVHEQQFDMLVMDEILISLRDKFVDEEVLIDFINNRPAHLELVLTGRGASNKIVELADYVSEIQCIKHPMQNGTPAREGVEF